MIPAIAAAGAVRTAVGGAQQFFGSYDKAKDATRQAVNANAAQIASVGGPLGIEAYRFLKARGGSGGTNIPPIPGVTGTGGFVDAWPSPPAREQAARLAQAIAARYEGAALPNPFGITSSTQAIDPLTGRPLGPAPASLFSGPLVVVGLIALVLFLATRTRTP